MKKFISWIWDDLIPALMLLGGAVAVTNGVMWIYYPAGLITGGVFCIAAGVLLMLGGKHNE